MVCSQVSFRVSFFLSLQELKEMLLEAVEVYTAKEQECEGLEKKLEEKAKAFTQQVRRYTEVLYFIFILLMGLHISWVGMNERRIYCRKSLPVSIEIQITLKGVSDVDVRLGYELGDLVYLD